MDEPRAAGPESIFSACGNMIHSLGKKECAVAKSGWRDQIILMINGCPEMLLQHSNTPTLQYSNSSEQWPTMGLTQAGPSGPESLLF